MENMTQQTAKQGQVYEKLDDQQKSIEEVEDCITNLEDRLASILEDKPPTEQKDKSPDPALVAVAYRIYEHNNRIRSQAMRLTVLMARVQL